MKKSLINSPVQFNEDGHTYTINGHTLNGVTPIIAWLFPNTYKGIPQDVLERAAQYGGMIHKKCELADSLGIVDHPSVQDYKELLEQRGLKPLLSEYLVSDEKDIASSIDKVFDTDNDCFDLADIKTTSKVHVPNVTMQLSIYAWLFERQNDGVKAGRLFCIWLPKPEYGQADIIELERIPSEVCEYVVELYLKGGSPLDAWSVLSQYRQLTSETKKRGDSPEWMKDMMDELINIKQAKDSLDEREKEIKDILLKQMQEQDIDKMGNDLIEVTRKGAYERTSIDSKLLQAQHPDIYKECLKKTVVKESITYKVL